MRGEGVAVSDAVTALKHFRCEVMGEDEVDGRLAKAFDSLGLENISDFLILEQSDFEFAVLDTTTTPVTKLSKIEIRKLLKAQEWYQNHPSSTKSVATWFDLNKDDFDTFLMNGHEKSQPVAPATSPVTGTTSDPYSTAALDFSKGIKRDVNQYRELSDDSKWITWSRDFRALAAVHGLENVLDAGYTPKTEGETQLFKAQQDFTYSIFSKCLKTTKSSCLPREFEIGHDAQGIYQKLLFVYEKGISGKIQQQNAREAIQKLKLTTSWTKTLESFLSAWEHKLLDYEYVMQKPTSDADKRDWLTEAIQGHEQLYGACTTSQVVQNTLSTSAEDISFHNYFDLIRNFAKVIDRNNKEKFKRQQKANSAKTDNKKSSGKGKKDQKSTQNKKGSDDGRFLDPETWNAMTEEQKESHKAKWRKIKAERRAKAKAAKRSANETQSTTNTTTPSTNTLAGIDNDAPPGSLLRAMLSANASNQSTSKHTTLAPGTKIMLNGQNFTACMAQRTYQVSQHSQAFHPNGSLIDGGCNGGLAGDDVMVIEESLQRVDVTGIADSKIEAVPIGTVAGLVQATDGPLIAIFHQYATYGKGKTIHSVNQLRSFGLEVNDIPKSCNGGKQSITTPDGFTIPLAIRDGLCYMDMRKPTEVEMEQFPQVLMTSDMPWNPQDLDAEPEDTDFLDTVEHEDDHDDWVDCDEDYGETFSEHELNVTSCLRAVNTSTWHALAGAIKPPRAILPKKPNFDALRPYFGWISSDKVKATLEHTTQWFRASCRMPMRRHYKTRFPAANVNRWNENVATDTFFSDVPAHDDGITGHGGCTMVQVYTGIKSHFTKVYPMSSESQIPDTLNDLIRDRGAPNNIKNDCAKAEISKAVHEILRHYKIGQYLTEPEQQNQNPAERRIQDIKNDVNRMMDRTGTPAEFWLLCTLFVVYVANLLSVESLGFLTPTQMACGYIPDVSALLHFRWWEPVYYLDDDGHFPSDSKEKAGRWVGVAEHVGDALTWWVLTDDTKQVIPRSVVRSALDTKQLNLRAMSPSDDPLSILDDDNPTSLDGEMAGERPTEDDTKSTPTILSTADIVLPPGFNPAELKLPRFSIEELMGRTFLLDMNDGQRLRAEIVRKIDNQDAKNHTKIKLLCKVGAEGAEEIMSYQEVCDLIEEQDKEEMGENKLWTFKKILSHSGPLTSKHKEWKGSQYNVRVLWDDNSITTEPLKLVVKDDPVTAAEYAHANGLLDTPGWKHLRHTVKNQKKFGRLIKQARLKSIRRAPIYMFGVQVPRNSHEARMLDEKNGNTKWQDAETEELKQLYGYETFNDLGKDGKPPPGYQKIRVHFVYAVKHDLRHKARLVAGGHLTEPPKDSVYSGVVSLRSMRLALLIGELNGLQPMVGDIGNAYLEAYTKEKVFFIAGKEFGPLAGHTMVIVKALYGLRTSGARFHERLADTLRDMKFTPSYADPDLWIRDAGDCYEYVCVYVDDLMAIMKKPQEFFDTLTGTYKYILKGVGPPQYHLGGNFGRDPDGILYWGAEGYVEKMINNYKRVFKCQPKKYSAPLDKDDSPELDQSDLLNEDQTCLYQSMIGALQWAVTLGRFDIAVSVMTMSSFRAAPREGHLERLKRIYGYLRKHPDGKIRFRTKIPPNDDSLSMPEHDWMYTVYGNCEEEISPDLPPPKGKFVRMTSFVDANLMHCKVTGKSATGILHLINQTPVDWFSRKQPTVETATYGSEFVAARQATEQIIDLRYTLRSMGVPIEKASWLLGDNRSVITSSTIPHSSLSKRHQALAYHRVRSAVAGGFLKFCHIKGTQNTADIMTKFLPYPVFWPFVQPLLFWKGETQVTTAQLLGSVKA